MAVVPNLFIVGAPRCGTSAMFGLIGQHQNIAVSHPKEPYYFCTDFREESDRHHGRPMRFPIRTEAEYLAVFKDRSRRFVAEATPAYLYSKAAAANIHAYSPDAKIIALVRNPIDVLHSLHAKFLTYGHENLQDFRQALQAEPERQTGQRLPRGLFWPSSLYYSRWVQFGEQIERYRRVFPAGQVKVVVHEDFRRDNIATYADILAFLGLDLFQPEIQRRNEHAVVRSAALARALTIVGDLPLMHLVPAELRRRIRSRVAKVNRRPVTREPMDPGLRRELIARFKPDVEHVSRVLDRDLVSLWGYA